MATIKATTTPKNRGKKVIPYFVAKIWHIFGSKWTNADVNSFCIQIFLMAKLNFYQILKFKSVLPCLKSVLSCCLNYLFTIGRSPILLKHIASNGIKNYTKLHKLCVANGLNDFFLNLEHS